MKTKAQKEDITFKIEDVDFCFKHVPGGTFLMGKTPEQGNMQGFGFELPLVEIEVDDFFMLETPVTMEQFSLFARTRTDKEVWWEHTGLTSKGLLQDQNDAKLPMVDVSWYDAVAYCEWLGDKQRRAFMLPTEAQWEFAARGGKESRGYRYAGSNDPKEVAWHDANSQGRRQEVGRLKPNELWLYDMSGNIWEWCYDRNKSSSYRVDRGGDWRLSTRDCRSAFRDYSHPAVRSVNIGFRIAAHP